MTLVQRYRCKSCDFRFGPVGVRPYEPERPQVFRFCRDCSKAQSLVLLDRTQPAQCVHCGSTRLEDLQKKCPICASPDVGWEPNL